MNIARAVQRPRVPGAQVRVQVLRALVRVRAGRPGLLHRGDGPPAPAADADREGHRGGRAARSVLRRRPPRARRSPWLRFANGPRARTLGTGPTPGSSRCRRCRPSSASTAGYQFVPRGRHRRLPGASPCAATCPGNLQLRRRRRARAPPRSATCSASRCGGAARRGARASRRGWRAGLGVRHPAGDAPAARSSARAWTTAGSRPPATPYRYTRRARRSRPTPRRCACARSCAAADEPYRYEREGGGVPAPQSHGAPRGPSRAGRPTREGRPTTAYDDLDAGVLSTCCRACPVHDLEALGPPRGGQMRAPAGGFGGDRAKSGAYTAC
jgi:hypothetical protein